MICRMNPFRPAGFLAALALAGCASFPELDAAITPEARTAPYPVIAPLADITAQTAPPRGAAESADDIAARAARLRERAATLDGPVVDAATREALRTAQGDG